MRRHVDQLRVVMGDRRVGQLSSDGRRGIFFQYDNGWLSDGLDLSPVTMTFDALPLQAAGEPFDGLHGVFNDSLPDGWGRLLMDRALKARFGWSREEITPLDRLAYIGSRGMGALEYEPETHGAAPEHAIDIASLAAASESVLRGTAGEVIADLYLQGGSPGGARPKITVARNAATGSCVSGFTAIPEGFEHWIVKFQGRGDSRELGRIEMAYAQMAVAAGLQVPETDLIELVVGKSKRAFFAARRFDRDQNTKKHVISVSGYLHADHRTPSLDYQYILAATQRLTRDVAEVAKTFRLMVFNVLAHNKDDHAKNFAFIATPAGWSLSPSFDLTYSAGIGNEHTSSIEGKGNPDLGDVMRLAQSFRIEDPARIVDDVRSAIAQWPKVASTWGVSGKSAKSIGASLAAVDKRFRPAAVPAPARSKKFASAKRPSTSRRSG
jgi:serine/threonine-protein kinase HipA